LLPVAVAGVPLVVLTALVAAELVAFCKELILSLSKAIQLPWVREVPQLRRVLARTTPQTTMVKILHYLDLPQ
jgi:hypothetical protein